MRAIIIVLFIGFLLVGCGERGESGIDGLTGPTGMPGTDSDIDGCDFNGYKDMVPEKCAYKYYTFPENFDEDTLCKGDGRGWNFVTSECYTKCIEPETYNVYTKVCSDQS